MSSPPTGISTAAAAELRMNNDFALAFAEDVLKGFPDLTVSANAAVRTHLDATRHCSQLIKSQFGVGHWFEGVVEGCSLSMHTPSPDSAPDLMTHLMQGCEIGHRFFAQDGNYECRQKNSMEPITATIVIVALVALGC